MIREIGVIHYQIDKAEQINNELINQVDSIRINPEISFSLIQKIIDQVKESVKIFIIDDIELAKKLEANGVFYSCPTSYKNMIEFNGDLLIGGMAYNLADCKNWELVGADFLDFNPSDRKEKAPILGAEGFRDLPSKNEAYGWMLFSLNVPVFIHHPQNIATVKEIIEVADIQGITLSGFYDFGNNAAQALADLRNLWIKY